MSPTKRMNEQQLRLCATYIRNFQNASIERCRLKKEQRRIEAALQTFDKDLAALKKLFNELLRGNGPVMPDRAAFERGIEPGNASFLRKFGLRRIAPMMLFVTYVTSYVSAQRKLFKERDRVEAQMQSKERAMAKLKTRFQNNENLILQKGRVMRISAKDHADNGCPNRLDMVVTNC